MPVSPDVLPAGASCTIYVSFAPDSAGSEAATFEIGDDGPASPQTVALSGNGIGGGTGTPGATVSPGSLSFGDDVVGNKTDARAVTLVNGGTAPLVITSVHLAGPDAADFSQGTECPVSPDYLPPAVRARPMSPSPRTARVRSRRR